MMERRALKFQGSSKRMESLERTIIELFTEQAARTPERIFAEYEGQSLSFDELDRRSDSLASFISAHTRRGDRVAVMMRNSLQSVVTVYGLFKAGVAWVPINVQQRAQGLKYVLEKSDPRVVIADRDLAETIEKSDADLSAVITLWSDGSGGELDAILDADRGFKSLAPDPADCAAIMFTSGTTGAPKGVIVSHQMLRLAAESVLTVSGASDSDIFFVWEPLYHIGGAQLLGLPVLRDIRLGMVSRFSASRFWAQVNETGATHIHYLGGILQILLKQPPSEKERSHSVRVAWGAGCVGDTYALVKERFGFEIRECFGMTEASSITSFADGTQQGTVGRPVQWFNVTIRDDSGVVLPAGERGEIVVEPKLPNSISAGYFRNEEATAATMKSGRLHTGDLGHLDENGLLYFHGRLTDSIRCRGENVSAWEVEQVVVGHPSVEDCAVIGINAEIGEQDIMLFVKLKQGEEANPSELSSWLEDKLAPYQLPRYIVHVQDFERTPSLRIQKHKLPRDKSTAWERSSRTTGEKL